MAACVALLRAINVGGHIVRMEELRRIFAACGLADAETFIASGNVMFSSDAADMGALERRLEAALERELGHAVGTFIRTREQLVRVAAHQACTAPVTAAGGAVYVLFVREPLGSAVASRLAALSTPADEFSVGEREVYWCRHGKLSETTVKDSQLGKAIVVPVTSRNMNTVVRLIARLDARSAPAAPRGRRRKGEQA